MMFEKFGVQSRRAIVYALAEARRSGTSRIGCEHLLLGLAHDRSGPAADALSHAGLSQGRLRQLMPAQPGSDPLDGDALASVGVDLDAVRESAERVFGPGALDHPGRGRTSGSRRVRMTSEARTAIELARRAAQASHSRSISSGHVLMGIIDEGSNNAIAMLAGAEVRPADLRADVERRSAQAG